jgi:hypothetical protein
VIKIYVSNSNGEEKMKAYWRVVGCAFFIFAGFGISTLHAQVKAPEPSVLHMQQTRTTSQGSQKGFPTYLAMYHVLDGAQSPAEMLALTGTLSLKNYDPTFSEVLVQIYYWQGTCPTHDINLTQSPSGIWTSILKNPSLSENTIDVNLNFPNPVPMTGCVGLYFGGGPVIQGKATMSVNLDLTYRQIKANSNSNTVINPGGGEYCFGQDAGCQNATVIDGEAFAVPTPLTTSGHLLALYGNISDSAFDGTSNFGPIPTGKSWGAGNDFYLLPGECGIFEENLNSQGVPNPAPLSTLHSWLPSNSLHLASVPLVDRIAPGETGKVQLQSQVENIFSVPVKVNAGDCLLNIFARTGNGATDNETQVLGLMAP